MSSFKNCLLLSLVLGLSFFYQESLLAQESPSKVQTEPFLSLADLHLDPFLACQKSPCPLIHKLEDSPIDQWEAIFKQQDAASSKYGKDSNFALIHSALLAAKNEGAKAQIQFVLVIGDFLAHNFNHKYFKYAKNKTQSAYEDFVNKTFGFLTLQLKAAFPHQDVYMVVGNNDSYGDDYSIQPGGQFFKELAKLEASLMQSKTAKEQLLRSFQQGGYYAVTSSSQANLRLIFLNSVLFSKKAKGSHLDEAAQLQLAWLHTELTQAREKNQRVLLSMHIPTGIDVYSTVLIPFSIIEFWEDVYSQRFLAELENAATQVMGVFPAHLHADAFQIFKNKQSSIPFTGNPFRKPLIWK